MSVFIILIMYILFIQNISVKNGLYCLNGGNDFSQILESYSIQHLPWDKKLSVKFITVDNKCFCFCFFKILK